MWLPFKTLVIIINTFEATFTEWSLLSSVRCHLWCSAKNAMNLYGSSIILLSTFILLEDQNLSPDRLKIRETKVWFRVVT